MTYVLSAAAPTEDPLTLPTPPAPRKRGALPVAAAIVPILGGLGMFAITRSPMSLMFAALGPIMLLASLLDGARTKRADQRQYRRDLATAVRAVDVLIDERHERERHARWVTHPDVARMCRDADSFWRPHPTRDGTIVLGIGPVGLDLDVAVGDTSEAAQRLRQKSHTLTRAPLVVPLDGGICVRGPALVAQAAVRALVLQACLTHAPDALRMVLGERAEDFMARLPHVRFSTAERTLTVAPADGDATQASMTWCEPGGTPPASARTVIDVDHRLCGVVVRDSLQREIHVEAVSLAQAEDLTQVLAAKAETARTAEEIVHWRNLTATPSDHKVGLPVQVGASGGVPYVIDIVADGPHAVVVGTTGSGKSELLVSWILSLCRSYTPDQVTFLLADFKGGTAFEPLADIAHVHGILTDLNEAMTKRAVLSLQAEVRRREAAIATAGARDITDPRVNMARLVIVVDEYAALVRLLPELDAVFTDIAARGRALGMHLVIGAQRAAGAIRDATLANAPLRIALRVTDSADSRAVVGSDGAALISGGIEGRGVAFVRRAADGVAQRMRSALSDATDVSELVERHPNREGGSWWDPLPRVIGVSELPRPSRGIVVGVADDIENLRRTPVVIEPGVERGWWVLGGPRSGKTNLVDLLASLNPDAVRVPTDPEGAWDVLAALESSSPALVLWDNVDSLLAALPEPWGREAAERLERLVRAAGSRQQTWVLTAQRASGQLSRIAELLPGRVLFAVPSRLDHIAAGGDPSSHDPSRPAGRAVMAKADVQFALCDGAPNPAQEQSTAVFTAPRGAVGVIARGARRLADGAVSSWGRGRKVVMVADLAAGAGAEEIGDAVIFGEPEQWQRAYACLEAVRMQGGLVVTTECLADARILTGDRATPPYALPGRAWWYRPGEAVLRVSLGEGVFMRQ